MVNRVKVAEIYLDLNTSYGTLNMEPAYQTLTVSNWIDVADALVAISEGAAAMYAAVLGGDQQRYRKAVTILARSEWSKKDRALIDELLGQEELPPSAHAVTI